MLEFSGQLRKMLTEYTKPIRYYSTFKDGLVEWNQLIGKEISLTHTGNQCLSCGLDKPIFRMGHCKECFYLSPQTNENIIRPELSKAHLGEEQRDLEWEKKFELQPHIVYIAISGGVKVGVTRVAQIPTRWIDQGATQAIVFAKTDNRYEAGMIEVALKDHLPDKTHYQRMLKNQNPEIDLIQTKHDLEKVIPNDFKNFFSQDNQIWEMNFPVEVYPSKVKSVNLTKAPTIEGKLMGIKGQYLIFENDTVFNARNHEGFVVLLKIFS